MIQRNLVVENLEELKDTLHEFKNRCEDMHYNNGVIEIAVGNIPEEGMSEILNTFHEYFPGMSVFGYSSYQHALHLNIESAIVISFILMENAVVDSFHRGIDTKEDFVEDCFKYAEELNAQIKAMKDVKAIEIYFSYLKASASKFLEIMTKDLEDVQVFGAIAADNWMGHIKNYITIENDDAFIIADDYVGPGVSGVIYRGEDLYVYEDYLFGWEPVGRYMDVTAQTITNQGTTTVETIDGMRPIDVYKKYLGVEAGDFFVQNIAEFPLVIERDGILIGRTPSGCGPNGEVYLEGDLLENEKVRFSYAEANTLLNNTRNAADRMEAFGAERLSLAICGNRFNFLQDDYYLEIDYYSEGRDIPPNIILGMGEIYRYKGKGGIFNSALVAIGMREGPKDNTSVQISHPKTISHHYDIVPLSERLSHFLSAMTGELVDAVHDAKAASRAKSEFLSNMSHEIRTPINAVLGMDEMILRECDDPQIQEYAQSIKNAGNILLGLVNDILDFSKIEAGKMDIVPVDYDFSSVLNDLFHMVRAKVEAKGLKFIANVNESIPCVLNGDEIRIKQVVTNILSNAFKYTEEGSITISIDYKKVSEDAVDFMVSIKDTGIGIKEEDIDKLFNAFQRVDEVHNRTIQGTGLGLNITQKLLHLMGSELVVKSQYGKGSEFSFVLRQKVVKWDPVGDYMESYKKALMTRDAYKEKFTAPEAEILVVDDMPINISVFRGLLKKTLVRIDEAGSGRECLDMTREKKYDLIFLDHRMPEMDGIETFNALRQDENNPNQQTPVISLTANAVSGAREFYIKSGFIDYITKPIMSDKLEIMMIDYLPKEKVKLEKVTEEDSSEKEELPTWIDDIDGVDKEEGLKNCGSAEMYAETIGSFADAAEENYRAIESLASAASIADYTIKVHALKSSARIIGANNLSKLAEKLEQAGDDGDIAAIMDKTPALLSGYKKIFERIKELRKEPEKTELPIMGEEQLKEALESIKELVLNYDYDSIKYIMETLKGYRIPEQYADRISRLKDYIRKADWDNIQKILDELV